MKRFRSTVATLAAVGSLFTMTVPAGAGGTSATAQSNDSYAASYVANAVTNVVATTQKISCFTPEVPFFTALYPDGGMSACNGAANTGEDPGPYATQAGSNPGYPASTPMRVKDHSESDIRVDPTNASHLIGQSKWFVSAEGYNHQLGFFESFDGGQSWPVQGHVPGYEGWTDDTDPVGAFDSYGNFYSLQLPYQFFYRPDGSHNFTVGGSQEPNPSIPAEAIAVAIRPHGASTARDWISTRNGQPDYIATYDSTGREPDKQWITIDTNPTLPDGSANPNFNTIYAMWVVFNGLTGCKPYYSTARALPNGTHTDWTTPRRLPTVNGTASDTYLLPQVDPSGVVYTTVVNFPSKQQYCCANVSVDYSTDGGQSWQGPLVVSDSIIQSPYVYPNTTFRSGILESFGIGPRLSAQEHYPLYVTWEDYSAGVANVNLSASYDGGHTWSAPIVVNDNATPADEFQPNLTVASNGTVAVAFYDRRLACPAAGTAEAAAAGLASDTYNPNYGGSLPPFGAANYCVNTSVQFYSATLVPRGHNIRLSAHTWDPQLNSPHVSCPACAVTFLGDYFGIDATGRYLYTTSVSTFNYGANQAFHQQQVVARVRLP